MKERIFHLIGDKSAKFWAISLKGKSHTVRFGRIGTQGQMKMKTFSSSEEARESQDRLIKEKVQEGYKEGAFPRRGGPEELNTPEALPVSGHNIGNTHSKLRPGLKRKPKNYPCYGIFLVSRPDEEAVKYLNDYGDELHAMAGSNCHLIWLPDNDSSYLKNNPKELRDKIRKHINALGESLHVAQELKVALTDFPCLAIFESVHPGGHRRIVVSLKPPISEGLSGTMRSVFSIIQSAVENHESPVTALERKRHEESLRRAGQSILGEVQSLTWRTLENILPALLVK